MKKKIFALVLALLCLLAMPALAAGYSKLGGIDVLSNPSGTIGGGTYAYNAATKTLTLNNVNLIGDMYVLHENFRDDFLDTIVLIGENSIHANDGGAFKVYGDITFTGAGSLTVTAPSFPIYVDEGDLIIDGVDIVAQDSETHSAAVSAPGVQTDYSDHSTDGKIEIRNGGSLTAKSNGLFVAVSTGSRGGILVTDGSRLVIDSRNIYNTCIYNGSLIVSDTSSVEMRSRFGGLPSQTVETAEAAVLTAGNFQNYNYGLSFNKGSEPYIFTVTQTAMDDGRNLVTITGAQKPNAGGEAIPMPDSGEAVPMPETGDESQPILWMAMLLTAAAYFLKRRKANA